MKVRALSVSEVNSYIKKTLKTDPILSGVTVKGEISNYRLHSSGHIYFSLKDSNSRLHCVMFRDAAGNLSFAPSEGMKVLARGAISVYERSGQYQLYVRDMSQDGLGELYEAFEQLKKSLESKGYFDDANKKELPFIPRKIGIVTSAEGAAVRDIITTINRRWGKAELLIYDTLVQGERAPEQICSGINYFNGIEPVDVIIIGRGGGSIEELWAFNDERVARAVFESQVPVISAVGHQRDFTIADFVADLRAPTPTAAGELAVPEIEALNTRLRGIRERIITAMEKQIKFARLKLYHIRDSYGLRQPRDRIVQLRQQTDEGLEDLTKAFGMYIKNRRQDVERKFAVLKGLSPLAILDRGYAMVRHGQTGETIKSVGGVDKGCTLDVLLKDGTLDVSVLEVKRG